MSTATEDARVFLGHFGTDPYWSRVVSEDGPLAALSLAIERLDHDLVGIRQVDAATYDRCTRDLLVEVLRGLVEGEEAER